MCQSKDKVAKTIERDLEEEIYKKDLNTTVVDSNLFGLILRKGEKKMMNLEIHKVEIDMDKKMLRVTATLSGQNSSSGSIELRETVHVLPDDLSKLSSLLQGIRQSVHKEIYSKLSRIVS